MAIIAVLDFGSQYTQVIARRIRECQVLTRIYHHTTLPPNLLKKVLRVLFFPWSR